jgi:hypothetical protein
MGKVKKNCRHCIHLEYEHDDGEYVSTNGYYLCAKREETEKLTSNLSKDSYLDKAKICCETLS